MPVGRTASGDAMIETERIVGAIRAAPLNSDPFDHVVLDGVFSEETYRDLLGRLPSTDLYVELRHKDAKLPDGSFARLEFGLTEANLRRLNGSERTFWNGIVHQLRDPGVERALAEKFACAWSGRPLEAAAKTTLRISLLRDLPGYAISPHQDIPRKVVTAQFYLPRDGRHADLGTTLYRHTGPGELERTVTLPFLPNSGYSFPVTANSWHGVDPVPVGVPPRDSLMLIWYLDEVWPKLRASAQQAARAVRSRWWRLAAGGMRARRGWRR